MAGKGDKTGLFELLIVLVIVIIIVWVGYSIAKAVNDAVNNPVGTLHAVKPSSVPPKNALDAFVKGFMSVFGL